MLRVRIITALVLAPLVVSAIYLLPSWGVAIFVAVVAGMGAYEWAAFCGAQSPLAKLGFVLAFFAAVALVAWAPAIWPMVIGSTAAIWLCAAAIVVTYPAAEGAMRQPVFVGALGLIVTVGAWVALVSIHRLPNGPNWLMWMLVLCWAADVGAYFAGRAFGRRKLALRVSPGKTWEGAIGGLALALLVCAGLLAYAGVFEPVWLALIVALVAVSVFGDLFESVLKRASAIKDSGSLLPGHGGMLDRIDSVLAVAPLFALYWLSQG